MKKSFPLALVAALVLPLCAETEVPESEADELSLDEDSSYGSQAAEPGKNSAMSRGVKPSCERYCAFIADV